MSSGRKVKIELTQAEAESLFRHAFNARFNDCAKLADKERVGKALDKIAYQLNAVRGKATP